MITTEFIEDLDYKIPLRSDLGILPGRIRPVDKELLRSYFARIAEANCVTPLELLYAIQPTPAEHKTFPICFGVVADEEYATQLAKTLRCTPEEILSCLLRQRDGIAFNAKWHPQRLRACAECQTTDKAWRRWNADPLCVVCPIHHTLLWDTNPDDYTNSVALLLRNKQQNWRERLRQPSPKLFELQEQLVDIRKAAMYRDPEVGPTKVVYQIAWLYRKALNMLQADEESGFTTNRVLQTALNELAHAGWTELERVEREPTPPKLTKGSGIGSGSRSVGAFRAEDLAALLTVTVPAANAALAGDRTPFDDLYDTLFSVTGYQHAPHVQRLQNESSETIGAPR